MEVAAIGAAASFSLADVSFDGTKVKDGSQCTCVGMMTLLLAAAAGRCQSRCKGHVPMGILIIILPIARQYRSYLCNLGHGY